MRCVLGHKRHQFTKIAQMSAHLYTEIDID